MLRHASVLAVGLVIIACSSEADPGEACNRPGGTMDVCAEGTVCGRPTDKTNAFVCIPRCGDDKDCPGGSDCKGVDGTNFKGCRFKE